MRKSSRSFRTISPTWWRAFSIWWIPVSNTPKYITSNLNLVYKTLNFNNSSTAINQLSPIKIIRMFWVETTFKQINQKGQSFYCSQTRRLTKWSSRKAVAIRMLILSYRTVNSRSMSSQWNQAIFKVVTLSRLKCMRSIRTSNRASAHTVHSISRTKGNTIYPAVRYWSSARSAMATSISVSLRIIC